MTNENNDDLASLAQKFERKIWISKGCRFLAQRRLLARDHASQLVISLFSVAVIAASVALLIIDPNQNNFKEYIAAFVIDCSVFILVLSNIESSKNYAMEAEKMLRGGQVLSKILNDLQLTKNSKNLTRESLEENISKYNQALMDFEVNHKDIDYFYFREIHRKHFMDAEEIEREKRLPLLQRINYKRYFYALLFLLNIWGMYILVILTPPFMFFLAYKYFL